MDQEHAIAFGPFRLEMPPGRLWRGDRIIPLRPRSLAMLGYLAAHPGRQRDARRLRELDADRRTAGQDVVLAGAIVARHLPRAAVRLIFASQERHHHVAWGQSKVEDKREVTVVGDQPVFRSIEREANAGLGGLVALD